MAYETWAPPKRGVGLVHSPALHDFILRNTDRLHVVEIEPQTAWTAVDPIAGPFSLLQSAAAMWRELPQTKYIHSVGMPLAGTRKPSAAQIAILSPLAAEFGCSYISEHLSVGGTPHENAGFLLPPCQSEAGIALAADNIRALSRATGLPVAIETGVSYLPPFAGEIPDGEFVREVALAADCGILLDIHNVYCNERNGRQSVSDFVAALPAERVWEMHVAGGFEVDGYWLDAHSGAMPSHLSTLARDVASGLPNLSAVIFEVFASYLDGDSEAMLDEALRQAEDVWAASGSGVVQSARFSTRRLDGPRLPDTTQWESGLTRSIRMQVPSGLGNDLSLVPPLTLYAKLTHSFRASSVARLLPRTLYMLLTAGRDLPEMLRDYERATSAPLFALNEADGFVRWCHEQPLIPPLTYAMADYELALLNVPLAASSIQVRFPGDPRPLFQAIADKRIPPTLLDGPPWEIEITPDEVGGPSLSMMNS